MPVDSERGRIVLPVAGGGHGRGHRYIVVGAGLRFLYPRGFYPLPFLPTNSSFIGDGACVAPQDGQQSL